MVLLSEDYLSMKIPHKTFVLSRIFIFQIFLLLSTGPSGWVRALYIESIEKVIFSVRFHDACLGPNKLLLNDTFGGEDSNTFASVSLLCHTILYNA
jgi:hypothetical protein